MPFLSINIQGLGRSRQQSIEATLEMGDDRIFLATCSKFWRGDCCHCTKVRAGWVVRRCELDFDCGILSLHYFATGQVYSIVESSAFQSKNIALKKHRGLRQR